MAQLEREGAARETELGLARQEVAALHSAQRASHTDMHLLITDLQVFDVPSSSV